jgi:uncharacterized protein YegP (UPF0339 family)
MYRWQLRTSDGEVIATSMESFMFREDAHSAVVVLQAAIPMARIIDGKAAENRSPS